MGRRTGNSQPVGATLDWAREFLPEYFGDASADFHRELFDALGNSGRRLIARVAPRGHAKSTCAAFAYPLWCVCTAARRNIVIVTHERSLATQFVRDIRHELESNDRIIAEYGDLSRDPADRGKRGAARRRWGASAFTASNGVTVQAKSTGASFRGVRVGPLRPDLIICDDLEKDEHVRTPEMRRKLEQWLRRVVIPALSPDGRLFVLGSIIHHDSLLAALADRKRFIGWDYQVYRAIEAEQRGDGRYYRKALWPARWPLEKLDQERDRIGTLAFEQEYQANPLDDTAQVFRPEWLQRYDAQELERREMVTLMAVDPASGSASGDFFAIWVGSVAVDTGVIYTRVLQLDRIGFVEQVRRIIATAQEWRPAKIGIETVAYQAALKQAIDEISRRDGLFLPVVELRTRENKRARIESLSVFLENGTLRLPRELSAEAERQFLQYPASKHDDAPDVCAMGVELARAFRTIHRIDGATVERDEDRRNGW